VSRIRSRQCEAAGAVVRGRGETAFGQAVAAAQDSRFGIGNARHHYATSASYIDHVAQGAYRVDISREIGGFDPTLIRNQDYDFDYRYRQTGARILIDPSVSFERRVRETPLALARQFHEYGYWKFLVLRRHPTSLHLRWLAPPSLVALLVAGVLLAWTRRGRRVLGLTLAAYGSVIGLGAAMLGRRTGPRVAARIPLGLATMHLSWGAGFLRALLRRR
jgi:GT2 family glycosyltransferase